MLEKFRENIFLKTTVAKSQEKSCFEFFEVFLLRIITHIMLQLAPNIVLDRVSLMKRAMRDVHELISLCLMYRDI